MLIAATSDLHGFFPDIPDCDVCVVAGDVIGAISHEQEREQWIAFQDWAIELAARGIVLVWVAGNHEFTVQHYGRDFTRRFPGHYLEDSGVVVGGVRFWGSPWQPWFGNWAFNAPEVDPGEEFLEGKFRRIPSNTDVLVTHSPPAGFHDYVNRRHVGSVALNRHCQRVEPKLHVFGHIHVGNGVTTIGETTLANVAHTETVGGHYRPRFPVVLFELENANAATAA